MKTLVQELPFYKKTSDLFQLYAQNPQAIFLDSSLQNELGRYSIICLNPYLTVKEATSTVCPARKALRP